MLNFLNNLRIRTQIIIIFTIFIVGFSLFFLLLIIHQKPSESVEIFIQK